jgi:eukaryotic-like serine/threonine-protein kinase
MTEPPLPEETIFAQAQEIESDAERAAFLDRACGDDLALRAEVETLLRADAGAGDLLDLPEDSPGASRQTGG